jgi:hypothetical protein
VKGSNENSFADFYFNYFVGDLGGGHLDGVSGKIFGDRRGFAV